MDCIICRRSVYKDPRSPGAGAHDYLGYSLRDVGARQLARMHVHRDGCLDAGLMALHERIPACPGLAHLFVDDQIGDRGYYYKISLWTDTLVLTTTALERLLGVL